MRPTEEGCGGGRTEKEKEEVLLELVGCEENEGCIERAFGCIGFRGVGNSGPEAVYHVHVHNQGPEGQ